MFWAFLWLRFEIQVSAIHVNYFEPRTQNKQFETNHFALRNKNGCFVVRNFSGCDLQRPKAGVFSPRNFQVVNKKGRFVARIFFANSTLGTFASTCPPPPPPTPARAKKLQPPLPPVKTQGVSPKRGSFRGTSVVTFMKTRGSFSPARHLNCG